jgi:hypothetical protein
MAAQRAFSDKRTGIIYRLLHPVGGCFVTLGNVRPNLENVGPGERRQRVGAYLWSDRRSRQLRFIA